MIKYIICVFMVIFMTGCTKEEDTKKVDFFSTIDKKIKEAKKQNEAGIILNDKSISLFQERRSYEVGDIITILLDENMNAKKNAKTSANKSSSGDIRAPILLGLKPTITGALASKFGTAGVGDLSIGYGGDTAWSGDGSSSQSNSLNGVIAAFVTAKLSNGNLKISGIKKLLINQGKETIVIEGIVRPIDIDTDNTILSTKIAGAKISYYGEGTVGNSQKMGWISGFFNGGGWLW